MFADGQLEWTLEAIKMDYGLVVIILSRNVISPPPYYTDNRLQRLVYFFVNRPKTTSELCPNHDWRYYVSRKQTPLPNYLAN